MAQLPQLNNNSVGHCCVASQKKDPSSVTSPSSFLALSLACLCCLLKGVLPPHNYESADTSSGAAILLRVQASPISDNDGFVPYGGRCCAAIHIAVTIRLLKVFEVFPPSLQ